MAKYRVHYESITQEKYYDDIEADSLEEAEEIAEAFCDEGDTSLFELDCVIGGGDKDEHPSIYSITKEGDEESPNYTGRCHSRYSTEDPAFKVARPRDSPRASVRVIGD
jgi:hypothetical protein